MCTGVRLNNEKVVPSARVVQKRALCFAHLFTQIASHEQHGVPMGNPHNSVLVTKSTFTYARKKIHSDGPRNKIHISNKQMPQCVGENILGSSLMIAHDGHMGQTAYRHVRHGAQFQEHPSTP